MWRQTKPLTWCLLLLGTGVAIGEEPYLTESYFEQWARRTPRDVEFQIVRGQEPEPLQPEPVQPVPTPEFGLRRAPRLDVAPAAADIVAPGEYRFTFPGGDTVTGNQVAATGAAGSGEVLRDSSQVQSVSVKRRSSMTLDPFIRGYNVNQMRTFYDGVSLPVRSDLDSALSKVDSSLIDRMTVIPGPYSVRNGPGFAFIEAVPVSTPRYEDGFEAHNRIGMSVRTNGGQVFGREAVYGGNSDYGFIFSYGNRVGGDYDSGSGFNIPGSYSVQNYAGSIGFDLSDGPTVEFRFSRLDQSDSEYAAQFFDVNYLGTDSFALNLHQEDPNGFSRYRLEAWYNRTRFYGDTELGAKRRVDYPVINRVEAAMTAAGQLPNDGSTFSGSTNGDLTSTGLRSIATYGDEEDLQLSLGIDLSYVENHIYEDFIVVSPTDVRTFFAETNLPRVHMMDPGLFVEFGGPILSYWTTTIGARVDWVHTETQSSGGAPDGLRPGTNLVGLPLSLDDVLYAFNMTNELELSPNWTARFRFGHAQRVPSLTERYADGVMLGMIQSGFSRVVGDPELASERVWQVDAGIEADLDIVQARIRGFHSWIQEYVTYQASVISDVSGARLLWATNTPLATLAGFEAYGELDLTNQLTAFGSLQYVDGRDRGIDVPLPGIAPLEGRTGLRLSDPGAEGRWGAELGVRMVHAQERLAFLRRLAVGGIDDLEQPTPGFSVCHLRGFWSVTDNLNLVAGVENLFNRAFFEHLDLRLPADPARGFPETTVYSPGITPYFSVEWTH